MGEVLWPQSLNLDEVPRAVICRNNAPLISLALSLLVSGRTVEVAGQDIGRGLVNLTKRITKRNLKVDEFIDRLSKWKDREIARYPRRKARIMDKFLALRALSSHHRDLKGIQDHLLKLYPNPSSRDYRPAEVHLSTIHRAKGREWPDVMFLDPQLLPSKYAAQTWELTQENNLAYVGITRAQRTLTYCASENIQGVDPTGDI
jgi:superfamily I DNA/RNA helicase